MIKGVLRNLIALLNETGDIFMNTTMLSGVYVVVAQRLHDQRGYFEETWSRQKFLNVGIEADFVQDNHSYSKSPGTLRGLHFQSPPHAQDKLIRCTHGAIFDVVVDVRRGSDTHGQWLGFELTPENGRQIFVPKGFLHGFQTLLPDTEIEYKCSDYYSPAADGSVRWDSVGIDWPISTAPILSQKDASAIPFSEFQSPFVLGVNS